MPFSDYSFLTENKPGIEEVPLHQPDVRLFILRLDQVHPTLSGNKLFKLTRFLDEARLSSEKKILTFGGPFSNHLVATAFACQQLSLSCIGIVRGEIHNPLSYTLKACQAFGMELHFMDRGRFAVVSFSDSDKELHETFGACTIIPTGGFGRKGVAGASDILDFIPENIYTHICVAVGSGTTLAGLLQPQRKETIIALPALKNMEDIPQRMIALGVEDSTRLTIESHYHFGGFAKKNNELFRFMNRFYENHRIPLDFVYTAKMMYGVTDLIHKKQFPAGSRILCIHTGGLQGNKSLPEGILSF